MRGEGVKKERQSSAVLVLRYAKFESVEYYQRKFG